MVVHVHFGMSGAWAVYNSIEDEEDVKPTTCLRLEEIPTTSHIVNKVVHMSPIFQP